jgi:hypothetical protein
MRVMLVCVSLRASSLLSFEVGAWRNSQGEGFSGGLTQIHSVARSVPLVRVIDRSRSWARA